MSILISKNTQHQLNLEENVILPYLVTKIS